MEISSECLQPSTKAKWNEPQERSDGVNLIIPRVMGGDFCKRLFTARDAGTRRTKKGKDNQRALRGQRPQRH
jgi:hypothetical protein